jgi:hypothetical protein
MQGETTQVTYARQSETRYQRKEGGARHISNAMRSDVRIFRKVRTGEAIQVGIARRSEARHLGKEMRAETRTLSKARRGELRHIEKASRDET